MPRNVEIKARVHNVPVLLSLVAGLDGVSESALLSQHDVFFVTLDPAERLKLRMQEKAPPKLIWYARPDQSGPKISDYVMCSVPEPERFLEVMRKTVGVRGEVKKTRVLHIVGQTRIHIDTVYKLGDFLEIEVALHDDQSTEDGAAIAADLMRRLRIRDEDLVHEAYIDLLLKQA